MPQRDARAATHLCSCCSCRELCACWPCQHYEGGEGGEGEALGCRGMEAGGKAGGGSSAEAEVNFGERGGLAVVKLLNWQIRRFKSFEVGCDKVLKPLSENLEQ